MTTFTLSPPRPIDPNETRVGPAADVFRFLHCVHTLGLPGGFSVAYGRPSWAEWAASKGLDPFLDAGKIIIVQGDGPVRIADDEVEVQRLKKLGMWTVPEG